jgi:hypothetical protein
MKHYLLIVISLIMLSGCSKNPIESGAINDNPTAKEMLSQDENADIFVMDGYVFSNAAHMEWIKDHEYELGEQLGELTKQTTDSWRFKEGTASKLPVGTKIYETNAPFYIAIVNGEEIPYIKLVEG